MPYVLSEWSAPEALVQSLADGAGIESSVAGTKASFTDFLVKGGVAPAQAAQAADALVHQIIDTLAHGGSPESAVASAKAGIGGVIEHLVQAAQNEGAPSLDQALAQGDVQALARAAHELGLDGLPPEAQKAALTAWQSALANGADPAHAREAALDKAQGMVKALADGAVELSHGDSLAAHLSSGGPEAAAALQAMTAGLPTAQAAALMNSLTGALAGGSQPSEALQGALAAARSAKETGDGQGVPVSAADMLVAALAGGGDVHAALAAAGLTGSGADAFLQALAGNAGSDAALSSAHAAQAAANQALAQASAGVSGSALAAALASGGAEAAAALAGMGGGGAGGEAFANALGQALASGASMDSALQSAASSASQAAAAAASGGSSLLAALASGQDAAGALAAAGAGGSESGQAFVAALSNALASGASMETALQQAGGAAGAAASQLASSSSPVPGTQVAQSGGGADPGPANSNSPDPSSSPSTGPSSTPSTEPSTGPSTGAQSSGGSTPVSITEMLNPGGNNPPPSPPEGPTVSELPLVTPTPPPAALNDTPSAPPIVSPPVIIQTSSSAPVVVMVTGHLVDGPIKGGRVFVDANANGKYDAGEYSVITDANGNFTIAADKLTQGKLTYDAVNPTGVDTQTLLPFKIAITAPLGEANLTAFTNLIAAVMAKGYSKAEALTKVTAAVGASGSDNLLSYDPSAAANQGSALAKTASSLLVLVSGVSSTITGSGVTSSSATAMSAVIDALATQVTTASGAVNLADTSVIASVMAATQTTVANATLDDTGSSADAKTVATSMKATATSGVTLAADNTSGKMVQILHELVTTISGAATTADANAATQTGLGDASSVLSTLAQNQAATLTDGSAAASSNLANSLSYAVSKFTGDGLATTVATAKTDIAGNQGGATTPSPPVAVADAVSSYHDAPITQNETVVISVLANDSDPQGKTLSLVNIVHLDSGSAVTKGVVSINSADGTVTYAPGHAFDYLAAGVTATDSFGYVVGNGTGQTSTGTVTVTITGTNDAPVLTAPAALAYTDTAAADTADSLGNRTGTLAATDVDTGAVLSYGVSGGTVANTTIGDVVYTVSKVGGYGTLYVNAGGAYVYVPNAAAINALGADASDSFTVTASDGSLSDGKTLTVNITAANDTPILSGLTAVSGNEDQSLAIAGVRIADADAGSGAETVTLSVGHGTLTLGSHTGLTFLSGDGTADASMSFTGTVSAIDTALAQLRYQGDANYNGADSLAVSVNDQGHTGAGGAQSASGSLGITLAAVNDAPTVAVNPPLFTSALPATTVAALFGGSFSDAADGADASPFYGVAVTGVSYAGMRNPSFTISATGTWEYSADGLIWTTLPDVSSSAALVLLPTDSLRFTPAEGFSGEASLTASLIENDPARQTPPADYATVNVGGDNSGGSTIYSSSAAPATLRDFTVNGTIAITETLNAVTQQGTSIGSAGEVKVYQMTLNAGEAYRFFGASGSLTDTYITGLYTSDGTLIPGTTNDDGGGSLQALVLYAPQTTGTYYIGLAGYSNHVGTFTLDITPTGMNHAPVLAAGSPALSNTTEDALSPSVATVSALLGSSVSDADGAGTPGIAVSALDQHAGTWEYRHSGGSWVAIDASQLTGANALLLGASDQIGFVPAAGWTGTAGFTFHAWDASYGTAGTYASIATTGGLSPFSTGTQTATLSVSPTPTGFPVSQDFSTSTPADWVIVGNSADTKITAGGKLQLTAASGGEDGSAIYNLPIDLHYGLHVTFDYFSGGGGGADGFSFFLLDGSQAHPTVGASGGSLGYGFNGSAVGASEAYLGIGFDRYGNFLNTSNWGASGGYLDGGVANAVSIRGHGNGTTGYDYITGSYADLSGPGIDGRREVDLTITPDQKLTLLMSFDSGVHWTTVYDNFDFGTQNDAGGYTPPTTVKLGFAASTGGVTDVHQIDNVTVSTPASSSLPVGSDGGVLGFDGTSTHVSIASPAAQSLTAALTVEAWVKVAANGNEVVVGDMASSAGYQLKITDGGVAEFDIGNGSAVTSVQGTTNVGDGAWHHLAGVYDGTSLSLYTDTAVATTTPGAGLLAASAAGLDIGSDGAHGSYFNGDITDVRLWSTARSAGDISSLMAQRLVGNESGLAGYWKLDESSGGTAAAANPGGPAGAVAGTATHLDLNSVTVAAGSTYQGMILGFDPHDASLQYNFTSDSTSYAAANTFTYTAPASAGDHTLAVSIADNAGDPSHHSANQFVAVHVAAG